MINKIIPNLMINNPYNQTQQIIEFCEVQIHNQRIITNSIPYTIIGVFLILNAISDLLKVYDKQIAEKLETTTEKINTIADFTKQMGIWTLLVTAIYYVIQLKFF